MGSGWGLLLRTHRAGKGRGGGGFGGWSSSSTEQKGPRHASLWSQRVGHPHLGAQQASWAQVGRANALHSSPAPPVPEVPSHLPLLVFAASLLSPQDQPSLEGTSGGVGPGPRAGQTSLADWAGETLGLLPTDLSPQGSLQVWEPLPPLSHPSGAPVLSGLHLSSPLSPVTSYRFTWGVLPISLGVRVPHQSPADALVVGRCELCVFPHCHLDSAP